MAREPKPGLGQRCTGGCSGGIEDCSSPFSRSRPRSSRCDRGVVGVGDALAVPDGEAVGLREPLADRRSWVVISSSDSSVPFHRRRSRWMRWAIRDASLRTTAPANAPSLPRGRIEGRQTADQVEQEVLAKIVEVCGRQAQAAYEADGRRAPPRPRGRAGRRSATAWRRRPAASRSGRSAGQGRGIWVGTEGSRDGVGCSASGSSGACPGLIDAPLCPPPVGTVKPTVPTSSDDGSTPSGSPPARCRAHRACARGPRPRGRYYPSSSAVWPSRAGSSWFRVSTRGERPVARTFAPIACSCAGRVLQRVGRAAERYFDRAVLSHREAVAEDLRGGDTTAAVRFVLPAVTAPGARFLVTGLQVRSTGDRRRTGPPPGRIPFGLRRRLCCGRDIGGLLERRSWRLQTREARQHPRFDITHRRHSKVLALHGRGLLQREDQVPEVRRRCCPSSRDPSSQSCRWPLLEFDLAAGVTVEAGTTMATSLAVEATETIASEVE